MAKSRAKKCRDKLSREGKMNSELKRSSFTFADMRTRTTKTKKDHLYQFKHKNHQSHDGNDGSFFCCHRKRFIGFINKGMFERMNNLKFLNINF